MALKPLLPRQFFREAVAAILDFASYRQLFQQPLQRSLLYLLQLTIIYALIFTLSYSLRWTPQFDHFLSWAKTGLPGFTVENGQLHVETESPSSFVYPGRQLYTFVFDTRENHSLPSSLDQPAVLLTRDRLSLPYLGQPFTWPWAQLESVLANTDHGIVVNARVIEELRQSLGWMTPFFFFFSLGISLFFKLLQAMLLTFLGISASSTQGVRLPYSNYLTIAIYALTPAIAIDLVVVILGQASDLFEVIYLLTAAIYTYLATQRCIALE